MEIWFLSSLLSVTPSVHPDKVKQEDPNLFLLYSQEIFSYSLRFICKQLSENEM